MDFVTEWTENASRLHETYREQDEHANCGVGMVAALDGKPRRDVVQAGIDALKAVWHRGAVDAPAARVAVGQVFLPKTDLSAQETCRGIVETAILSFGHAIHGWRQV